MESPHDTNRLRYFTSDLIYMVLLIDAPNLGTNIGATGVYLPLLPVNIATVPLFAY